MLDHVLDAIAPRRCAGCATHGAALCRRCLHAIDELPQPVLARGAAAFPYGGAVRAVLWRGKFRDHRSGLRQLADLGAARLDPPADHAVVVPIPLAARRRRARGYNQAEVIARVLAEHHGLGVAPSLLRRRRDTAEQSRLDASRRVANVEAAFTAPTGVAGLTVWLIDDVLTTGSTMDAATVVLEAAGAERVEVAVLAAVL